MRGFQKSSFKRYHYKNESIRYLHENVLRCSSIGMYEGFIDEYGQTLRINSMYMLKEKDIIRELTNFPGKRKINSNKYRQKNDDKYKSRTSFISKILVELYKTIEKSYFNALGAEFIRAG